MTPAVPAPHADGQLPIDLDCPAERSAELRKEPSCRGGCKMVAIILGIGFLLVLGTLFVATLLFSAVHDAVYEAEYADEGASIDHSAAEERFVEAMAQAGDTAYVVQLTNPAAGSEVRTYVLVPVEVTRESDEMTSVATKLRPNGEDPSSFRYRLYDASVVGALEEAGYPALHEAAYRAVFDHDPGTCWVLYAFDVDSSAYWEPQVNFQVSDGEVQVARSFTYRAEQVGLEELEAIARQHAVREEG